MVLGILNGVIVVPVDRILTDVGTFEGEFVDLGGGLTVDAL